MESEITKKKKHWMDRIDNKEEKQTIILAKLERVGKNGKKYLILKTNPKKIFVFHDYVPEKHWDKLQVGKKIILRVEPSKYKDYVLHEFKIIEELYKDKRGTVVTIVE